METEFEIKLVNTNKWISVQSEKYGREIFEPIVINGVIHLRNLKKSKVKSEQFSIGNLSKSSFPAKKELSSKKSSFSDDTIPAVRSNFAEDSSDRMRNYSGVINYCHDYLTNSKSLVEHSGGIFRDSAEHHTFIFSTPIMGKFAQISNRSLTQRNDISRGNVNSKKISSKSLMKTAIENNHSISINNIPKDFCINDNHNSLITYKTPKNSSSIRRKLQNSQRQPYETVTKWRKCLTPIRTYSRRSKISHRSLEDGKENSPTLSNRANDTIATIGLLEQSERCKCTKGTEGDFEIIIKRRKIIIDKKTVISPEKIKLQLLEAEEPLKHKQKLSSDGFGKKFDLNYRKNNTVGKLLTNPSRNGCFSLQLGKMFKEKCLESSRSAPTDPEFSKDLKPFLESFKEINNFKAKKKLRI